MLALGQVKFDSAMAEFLTTEIPVAEATDVEKSRWPPHARVQAFTPLMIMKAVFNPRAA